jgi:zinc-finger of transposase IS204/IS1001/IS1096/IS1165
MPTTPLFPLPEGLEMTSLSDTAEELLVHVTSYRASSPCPQCATPSSAIHSSYHRHPRDLPCIGRPIRLVFTVHKFFCRNPNCPRKVFAERLPDFLEASSRLTKRLRTLVQDIGFATCGKGGEGLADKLGMPISDASLLWSLFLVPLRCRLVRCVSLEWTIGVRHEVAYVAVRTHERRLLPGVLPPVPCQAESSAPGTM